MRSDALDQLRMLASAVSGRDLGVSDAGAGALAWTDGQIIYVDSSADFQTQIQQLCVQCALIAAGSLDRDLLLRLKRQQKVASRYLAIEGQRALHALADIMPPAMQPLLDQPPVVQRPPMALGALSPAGSLDLALGRSDMADAPINYGTLRVRELLAATFSPAGKALKGSPIPPPQTGLEMVEFNEDAPDEDEAADDVATSPVGGGGGLGKLLQKLLRMTRKLKGGGTPGADAATHWSRSVSGAGVRAMSSAAATETVAEAFGKGAGILYPEWNVQRQCYRDDWCTVMETDPPSHIQTPVQWSESYGLRKPLSRLGMGLDRFHRQRQGDDIDIDAAIEAQVEIMAGSAPGESFYIESQRHRRDLSVLILLDISGSVSQAGPAGTPVHEQQRGVAAALATVLYDIGDRVALYAFHSQGRASVNLVPVKRFAEVLDSKVMSRLYSLIPGAYSRLGAAIRHGAHLLNAQGGTSRKLLVVLSDGLAYDHGYEPAYGAADARHALSEARRDGVGCLCLSVGTNTEVEVLRSVFGSAAFATIPRPAQLGQMIGPLFRRALWAAEVQRRAA